MTTLSSTSTVGLFARLVDEGDVARVTLGIEKAIEASFVSHPMRAMTTSEVKRRFDMCVKIFLSLRGDLKWATPRVIDHFEPFLKKELDGIDWTPDKRSCWMPGDG